MRYLRTGVCMVGYAALSGCVPADHPPARPAILTDGSPGSREELARAIGKAIHRPPPLLADDALMHESVLIVERAPHRDPNGQLLNGRELGPPERFRLVKQGAECVLIHEGAGWQWRLKQACTLSPP